MNWFIKTTYLFAKKLKVLIDIFFLISLRRFEVYPIVKTMGYTSGIGENTEVEVTIAVKQKELSPILRVAGILSEEEANTMLRIVEEEFERVNPDEWKV